MQDNGEIRQRIRRMLTVAGIKPERNDINEYLDLARQTGIENVETAFAAALAEGTHYYLINVANRARSLANGGEPTVKAAKVNDRRSGYERPRDPLVDDIPLPAIVGPPQTMHGQIWAEVVEEMRLQLVPGAYLDWVRPLRAVCLRDDTLVVECPDQRRLEIANYRKGFFLRVLKSFGFRDCALEFVTAQSTPAAGERRF